ncbi:MAG: hypothetical protein ACPGVT_02970 [Maricaulaceae bacterium]
MVNGPNNIDVLEHLKEWLETMSGDMRSESNEATQLAISRAASQLGYGEPYDREQKRLNDLLVSHRANGLGCLSVWSAYHDYKIAQAHGKMKRP